MSWVKIDDHFPDHPKLLSLPDDQYDACVCLHIRGLCYCAANLTDGFIPARTFRGDPSVPTLVAAGMWETTAGGQLIHDYLKYNPSRDEARTLSETRSVLGSKGADARWHGNSHSNSDGKPMANGIAVPVPVPLTVPLTPKTPTADLTGEAADDIIRDFEQLLEGRAVSSLDQTRIRAMVKTYGEVLVQRGIIASAGKDRPVDWMAAAIPKWQNEIATNGEKPMVLDMSEYR